MSMSTTADLINSIHADFLQHLDEGIPIENIVLASHIIEQYLVEFHNEIYQIQWIGDGFFTIFIDDNYKITIQIYSDLDDRNVIFNLYEKMHDDRSAYKNVFNHGTADPQIYKSILREIRSKYEQLVIKRNDSKI